VVDHQIQSPKSPLNRIHLQKLVKNPEFPNFFQASMEKIHEVGKQNERNRTMVMVIKKKFKQGVHETMKQQGETFGWQKHGFHEFLDLNFENLH